MSVLDDLRYALRSLVRGRMTTAVLLISLALGTGANATLFSVMDALLFRAPAAIVHPHRLAWVFTSQFTGAPHGLTSYPDFQAMQASGTFASLAAFDDAAVVVVRLGDVAQRVRVAAVSPEFFPTLGMQVPRVSPGSEDPGATSARVTSPGSEDPGATSARVTSPGSEDPGATSARVASPGSEDPGATSARVASPGSEDPGATSARVTSPGSEDPGATSVSGATPAPVAPGSSDPGGRHRPAIISTTLWTQFGSPSDAVGRELQIGDATYTVAAVAPGGFNGLQLGRACEVWIPLVAGGGRGDRRLSVIGRLRTDRHLGDTDEALRALGERLSASYPETNRGTRTDPDEPRRLSASAYTRLDVAARSQVLLISTVVLGSTALLLVSACVNAGSLLLSRSAARRRELAVKLALGASRAVLVRQVLFESLVISLGGALLGLLFAHWTAGVLPAFLAPEEAAMLDTRLDAWTVATTIALSCVAGALFAMGPARHALQTVNVLVLRGDAGAISDRTGSGVRGAVVIFQVALSTVLLIASGLLVRALGVALEGDLGPGGRGVAIAVIRMPGALQGQVARGIVFHGAAAAAARKLPRAEAAGWVSILPVGRSTSQMFRFEPRPGVVERLDVEVNVATSGYFQALRIPLIEGRLFGADDGALAKPVIIVNDMLARRYFGPDAAGRRLQDAEGVEYEIVGVVRSGRYRTLQEAPEPMVYFPLSQRDQQYLHLVVRTADSGADAVAALPGLLSSIDSGVDVFRTTTFDVHLSEALTLDRILTVVVAGCGVAALMLAMIGVYGVVGDAVRRRTPEIGLRVALGAPNLRILQLVFNEGVPLSAAGSAVGVAAALVISRTMRSFVHDLPPVDLLSLAVVPVALLLVVVGAAAIPVRRALRVSPTIALRADS